MENKFVDYLIAKFKENPIYNIIGVSVTIEEYCAYSGIADKEEAKKDLIKECRNISKIIIENKDNLGEMHVIDNWRIDDVADKAKIVLGLAFIGYILNERDNKDE